MSKVLLISLVVLVGLGFFLSQTAPELKSSENDSLYEKFQAWKMEHSKMYENKFVDQYRFQVYVENLKHIIAENLKGHTYTLGENQFMDMSREEWMATYLNPIENESNKVIDESEMNEENAAFNWATQGAVTPVKNQGQCGSCWAFSSTGTVEGYWKINKGSLPSLSEQQLVDCSTANHGCNGGWPYKALAWVQANGLVTESQYPYTGKDGRCTTSSGPYKIGSVARSSGCASLTNDIKSQPTSVCVDASNWSFYKSGVFSNCGTATNHAVLATGWDASNNWIIKNSWGTTWGEKGYITLKNGNTCAVCSQLANAN